MLVPHRTFSSPEYRYGFQGQEKDDEVKGNGNSVNFKYRMYDPRMGRFFATDPLERNYPYYTPYSFSGNKVIAFRELEGMEQKYFQLFLYNDGTHCVLELSELERESSYFSPDRINLYVYENEGEAGAVASYSFIKDLPANDNIDAINIANPYEKYQEFVEDPIGSMLSGEFKTDEQVLKGLAVNVAIALVFKRMGNLPKGSISKTRGVTPKMTAPKSIGAKAKKGAKIPVEGENLVLTGRIYQKGGRHGVKQSNAQAQNIANLDEKPHGTFGSKKDVEFAGEKAGTLNPGATKSEGGFMDFELPKNNSSKVFLPNSGGSVPATHVRVRNNGDGSFHGFPINKTYAEPIYKHATLKTN